MNTAEKRQAIVEVVESGRVSGNRIEPSRKGSTVTRLRKGKPVSDGTIDRLYEPMLAVLGETRVDPSITKDNKFDNKVTITKDNNPVSCISPAEIATIMSEIERLSEEVESLKARMDNKLDNKTVQSDNKVTLADNKDCYREGDEVSGFKIRLQKNTVTGRSYYKWYGIRRIEGKLERVYLGEVPKRGHVENKIQTYLARRAGQTT